ncbi:small GTP-binding protein [Alkalibacillus flavidus]|uniref:Small GTP-binding protein n=1 Tax=Alkalibacillus flavidus TaxID=546021 RepID=A0ABV2KT11_9BACI
MAIGTETKLNLDALFHVATQHGYETEKQMIVDIYQKWQQQDTVIGFTGHFSAGKSSMINHILNRDILPSSPIPTSANIVEIKHGDDHVTYHLGDNRYATSDSIQMGEVQRLSKNGDDVQSLTIKTDLPFLNGTTLMDTPGIDSADDAEFERTLSRVHLIDYFVYVVDYNHVQSEVNFQFLAELESKGVPYMIVVNQVDKHNDEEMQMDDYLQALRDSCANWELQPETIFTTSLVDDEHDYNQLQSLTDYMMALTEDVYKRLPKRMVGETERLIERLANLQFTDEDRDINSEDEKSYEDQYHNLKHQLQMLTLDESSFITDHKQAIGKMTNEAYLMTADIRENAREYLESVQPKFKVGGLFAKKKTAEEKQRRLNIFLENLQKRITTEINWHIRRHLVNIYDQQSLSHPDLKQAIQQYDYEIDEQMVRDAINPSAEVTKEYILQYTETLQHRITQNVKQDITPLLKQLFDNISEASEEKRESLNRALQDIEAKWEEAQQTNRETIEKKQFIGQLKRQTFQSDQPSEALDEAVLKIEQERQLIPVDAIISDEIEGTDDAIVDVSDDDETQIDIETVRTQALDVLNDIEAIPLLQDTYAKINGTLAQLDHQEYTVALFGAFSAGKSSFANAWIGDALLPVSPNPTTAAINKIAPPNHDYEHGNVVVRFKSSDTLIHQVKQLLEPATDKQFKSLDQMYSFINKQQDYLERVLSKTDWSFLDAFAKGRQHSEALLNESITLDLIQFKPYVTDETLSCYVEEIVIYYACDLTNQGVTLVDTPGADSIHARHTNVSMHYVRHSDVIVYVNYYNHAFARADREFLSQLGRVKSAFSLDKMFFVLNAADLAADHDELIDVQQYLQQQLQQNGIHKPQIFALSSKQLNEQPEKKQSDKQAKAFFERFNTFIETDAKMMVAHTLQHDLDQLASFVDQTVNELMQHQSEQDALIKQYQDQLANLQTKRSSLDLAIYHQQMNQQITELLHYLQERVQIQLMDMMKEAVNPATISDKGKRGQHQLKQALKELGISIERRLENEFNSTNLILDRHFQDVLETMVNDFNQWVLRETNFDALYIGEQALPDASSGEFETIFDHLDVSQMTTYYKDQKQFFVQKGVQTLFDQIESNVSDYLKVVQAQFVEIFQKHYSHQLNHIVREETTQFVERIEQMIESKRKLYHDEVQAEQIRQLQQKLQQKL